MTEILVTDQTLANITRDFAARAAEHDRENTFPFENFETLQKEDLLGLTAPKHLGGADADLSTVRRVVHAVAKGDPSTALVLALQYGFQRMVAFDPGWPDPLRERIGREAVENGALVNILSVEPELGTPQRGGLPATIGRRDGDVWRVSGRKLYSTGIPILTWVPTVGRTDEDEPRFGLFVFRRDAPGIRVNETWDHLGMRATHSHDVILEDVPVPLENFIPMTPFTQQRPDPEQARRFAWHNVVFATLYNAIAVSARDWLVEYLASAPQREAAASSAAATIGAIDALLFANRTLLDGITEKIEHEKIFNPLHGSLARYLVIKNAIEAVAKALSVTADRFVPNNPLDRLYRDVLCGRVHAPQSDMVLTGAGRAAFAAAA